MFNFLKKKKKPPEGSEPISVKKIEFKSGVSTITVAHPLFPVIIDSLVDLFKDSKGENYLSMGIWREDVGALEVILQRQEGKTPAQLKYELEEKYKKDILFLTRYLCKHPGIWDGPCDCAECRRTHDQKDTN